MRIDADWKGMEEVGEVKVQMQVQMEVEVEVQVEVDVVMEVATARSGVNVCETPKGYQR